MKGWVEKGEKGKNLFVIVDKYAVTFALQDGQQGAQLARNTVLSYFSNVKNSFIEKFPEQARPSLDVCRSYSHNSTISAPREQLSR